MLWLRYTHGFFVDHCGNVREDTDKNGRLTYKEGLIVQPYKSGDDLRVRRLRDDDADGSSDVELASRPYEDVQSLWEAGKRLALTDPASRTLYTWVNPDAGLKSATDADKIPFTLDQVSTLAPFLGPDTISAEDIIRFVRGEQPAGTRDRMVTVEAEPRVWKLGGPVH